MIRILNFIIFVFIAMILAAVFHFGYEIGSRNQNQIQIKHKRDIEMLKLHIKELKASGAKIYKC